MSAVSFIRRCLAAGMDLELALQAAEQFEAEAVTLTPRQARNKRYYEKKAAEREASEPSEKRLKASYEDTAPKASESVLKASEASEFKTPLARVRDNITNSVDNLVVVEDASASAPDEWPKGDLVALLVSTIASPRLDPSKSPGLITTAGRLLAWKRDGASWTYDVVPVVTTTAQKRGPPIGTWKYFDAAIANSIAQNRQALSIPEASDVQRPHRPQQQSTTRADRRGVWAEVLAEERGAGLGADVEPPGGPIRVLEDHRG